jgi:AcrR family transcriptional regulator
MAATYLRLADEIAERISSGELAPGDRAPSTRQIARDSGVAIATATKVIAELQQRGLVRPVPGIGTLVGSAVETSRRTAAPRRTGDDTRAEIVRTAVALADGEGIAAVSMRRIAIEMGVATMSLYRWVPSKDELIRLMIDEAIDVGPWPDPPPAGWRAQMAYAAHRQWEAGTRHPWLSRIISVTRPQLAPRAMKLTDWCMNALMDEGMSILDALQTSVALTGFVQGIGLNNETERHAALDSGMTSDEWMETQARMAEQIIMSGDFPTLEKVIAQPDIDFQLVHVFEIGLELFLDGIERRLAASR